MDRTVSVLEQARRDAGLSRTELWLRYFELGGMSAPIEVDAILNEALVPTPHDRDVIVVALDERFRELGLDRSVPDSDDLR